MSDARALCREAFQHFAENRIDEAIACYRRALDVAPDLVIAWNGLSTTLKRKGDLDGAIEAGLRIVEVMAAYAREAEAAWGITGLNVRVGLNTGPAAVGTVGAGTPGTVALGDTTNVAARRSKSRTFTP